MNKPNKYTDLENLENIKLSVKGEVASIFLNRPGVRNALNIDMIREISSAIKLLNADKRIRLILFDSTSSHFCSGADLRWMQSGLEMTEDQLRGESRELAGLYRLIWESKAVTICSVKGPVPGGAIGLLAASDFVVAESSVVLIFSEVKLGLVPSTIAPYILRKAGFSKTSDWMLTGRPISAEEAREAGIIHRICDEGDLEDSTGLLIRDLLAKGKEALKGVKVLVRKLENLKDPDEIVNYTSDTIAGFRTSPEGQEGMKAFLEKRKPSWNEGK